MAYVKDIPRPKCFCGKRATKAVYNHYNALVGEFCAPCARRCLKRMQADEDAGPTPY